MNSELIQVIALDKMVQKFTIELIKVCKEKNIDPREKFTLHNDLIPHLSSQIQERAMKPQVITLQNQLNTSQKIPIKIKQTAPLNVIPLPFNEPTPQKLTHSEPALPPTPNIPIPTPNKILSSPPAPQPKLVTPEILQPLIPNPEISSPYAQEPYGRITPVLNDPSVSIIECNGPNRPIMVTRYGQKQITKISLSTEEINTILDSISQETHIPLIEGVFRAALDNFSVTGIISEAIGSKFSLKKKRY